MVVASALGKIGRRLAAFVIWAGTGPAVLQAQAGLSSGAAQIELIARVAPSASINGVSRARRTARMGTLTEETVKVRLSANTGYRLAVVGTGPVSSNAEPASRLWVRAENGRFVELGSGAGVTVVRGNHAVADWEAEVSFRHEALQSVEKPHVLPVRYELRIDPAI